MPANTRAEQLWQISHPCGLAPRAMEARILLLGLVADLIWIFFFPEHDWLVSLWTDDVSVRLRVLSILCRAAASASSPDELLKTRLATGFHRSCRKNECLSL